MWRSLIIEPITPVSNRYCRPYLKVAFGRDVATTPNSYGVEYANGRSASIIVEGNEVGKIGEISDFVRQSHRIRVPVASL